MRVTTLVPASSQSVDDNNNEVSRKLERLEKALSTSGTVHTVDSPLSDIGGSHRNYSALQGIQSVVQYLYLYNKCGDERFS